MHMLFTKAIKQTDPKMPFFSLISMNFKINLDVDYEIQHKYRSKAISNFFMKEFAFAIIMTLVLAYINLKYITFFQGPLLYFETTIGEESRKYD